MKLSELFEELFLEIDRRGFLKGLGAIAATAASVDSEAMTADEMCDVCFKQIKPQLKGRKVLKAGVYSNAGKGSFGQRHVNYTASFDVQGARKVGWKPGRNAEDFNCVFDKDGKMLSDTWSKEQEQDRKEAEAKASKKSADAEMKKRAERYNK